MKVALVCQPWDDPSPPNVRGSIAIWSTEVGKRLASEAQVLVYGKQSPGSAREDEHDGVRFKRLALGTDWKLGKLASALARARILRGPIFASRLYFLAYALRVARDARREGCDVVHLHNLVSFVPVFRAILPGVRIVLHMHCEWLTQLDEHVTGRRVRQCDLVLGCSDHITGKVRARFPEAAERVRTVYNGVDPERFAPAATGADRRTLLFVGRLSPEKGVHLLLEAFGRLCERYPDLGLTVIGPEGASPREFLVDASDDPLVSGLARYYEAPYMVTLEGLLDPAQRARVDLVGRVPHDELARRYQAATVLVNPSLSESFGMSLIEAMACGTPVVAARVGGMPEILEHGATGLCVPANDAGELAAAIAELLDDDERRAEMGRRGRERVLDRFAWDRIAGDVLSLYQGPVRRMGGRA